ncbi:hypothetical protein F2Q68_00016980 [Brassica cretica]|uniref:Uncharacterized protein n=1 Tax=Brassica cretica TaxID=69181 RepID=A0A8S9HD64_BRACR|nr:hypothetical protein F2Q68_00016980 [Brassica cretica]
MNPTSRHIYVSTNANNEGAAAAVVHGYDGNNKKSISVVMTHDGPAMVKRSLRVEIRQLHAQERARHHPRSHGSSRLKIQWDLRVEEADTRDPASQSIDITTSPSIDTSILGSIDTDSNCRLTPPEIPEKSNCPQDIANSKVKSSDDLEMKLDQLTSGRDLGTSLKAGIDREPPYIIDLHPPYIIDRHATYTIDLHLPDCIDRHSPNDIDRHPSLDELPGYIVELEQVEEREYKSETSHLFLTRHLRPPICAEESARFHKRLKRIHDHVKTVVPCDVSEVEWLIPPDRSLQLHMVSGKLECAADASHSHLRALLIAEMIDKGEESMEEAFTKE